MSNPIDPVNAVERSLKLLEQHLDAIRESGTQAATVQTTANRNIRWKGMSAEEILERFPQLDDYQASTLEEFLAEDSSQAAALARNSGKLPRAEQERLFASLIQGLNGKQLEQLYLALDVDRHAPSLISVIADRGSADAKVEFLRSFLPMIDSLTNKNPMSPGKDVHHAGQLLNTLAGNIGAQQELFATTTASEKTALRYASVASALQALISDSLLEGKQKKAAIWILNNIRVEPAPLEDKSLAEMIELAREQNDSMAGATQSLYLDARLQSVFSILAASTSVREKFHGV